MRGGRSSGILVDLVHVETMAPHEPNDETRPPAPIPAREPATTVPTPIRESLSDSPGGHGTVEEERGPTVARTLEEAGATWTAQAVGVARSGAAGASALILLVRFEPPEGGSHPPREVWVVARSLSDLSDGQLEEAFGRSVPAAEPWRAKPLFPEAGSKGGRDG